MAALDVDISTMTIVDQAPADGAVSLADGSVAMAASSAVHQQRPLVRLARQSWPLRKRRCRYRLFRRCIRHREIRHRESRSSAHIPAGDQEANQAWKGKTLQIRKYLLTPVVGAAESDGGFHLPNHRRTAEWLLRQNGVAVSAAESLGRFSKPGAWNVDEKIAKVITGEFLE